MPVHTTASPSTAQIVVAGGTSVGRLDHARGKVTSATAATDIATTPSAGTSLSFVETMNGAVA